MTPSVLRCCLTCRRSRTTPWPARMAQGCATVEQPGCRPGHETQPAPAPRRLDGGIRPHAGATETDPGYIAAMRAWLFVTLCLSFALQGWAAAPSLSAPCPMEAETVMTMAHMALDQTADDTLSGDCCNDMATFLLTGQACKTGQHCQAPLTALLLPLPEKSMVAVVRQTVPVLQSLAAPSAIVVAVWRPPTFH